MIQRPTIPMETLRLRPGDGRPHEHIGVRRASDEDQVPSHKEIGHDAVERDWWFPRRIDHGGGTSRSGVQVFGAESRLFEVQPWVRAVEAGDGEDDEEKGEKHHVRRCGLRGSRQEVGILFHERDLTDRASGEAAKRGGIRGRSACPRPPPPKTTDSLDGDKIVLDQDIHVHSLW